MATLKIVQDKPGGTLHVRWGVASRTKGSIIVPGVNGLLVVDVDDGNRPVGIELVEYRPPNPEADIKIETEILQGDPQWNRGQPRRMKRAKAA